MPGLLATVRKARVIAKPQSHIFLLSHMRAYTSLFGHILGSNPAICGYYEMHIGYHSWRSLHRQKILYFSEEDVKPQLTYMFDKVLHNDHNMALNVLNMKRTRTIFALREPQVVVPSILKLYARVDPKHEFNSEEFATQYYIRRLTELENLAQLMQQPYFYMDAESLKRNSQHCLQQLSEWLKLKKPLSPSYELQRNSLRERYGDNSDRMKAGTIAADTSNYESYQSNPESMALAIEVFTRTRDRLVAGSEAQSLLGC